VVFSSVSGRITTNSSKTHSPGYVILTHLTVEADNRLTIQKLPGNNHNLTEKEQPKGTYSLAITMTKSEEYINILSVLEAFFENGKRASRQKIHSSLEQSPTPLSIQQIRTRFVELQDLEFVSSQGGRTWDNQRDNVLTIT
jgi:sigma-54 dependent transcriptional regulator, acetoin dehydrogenase operon transcriptional activator AcoR